MASSLAVGPNGRLWLAADDEITAAAVPEPLLRQFQSSLAESNAAGLVMFVSPDWPDELPASFAFWRNWARVFYRSVCHADAEPGDGWRSLPWPAEDELAAFVSSAPPMVGLEFITETFLQQTWAELRDYVADVSTADADGPLAWLNRVNPLAHLIGKVTFHLAEHKRNPHRPFAFLATFTHKLSPRAKPQHCPLAVALKQSVADGDREQLDRLLEPVRRAAERSPLAAELLKSKRLFSPQAWTAEEAYRFLRQSPAMEAAGVIIRLPNWWSARRPLRPQVQVRLGKQQPSSLGVDSLLDFDSDVVLEGEPLSPEELKRLMLEPVGLALLRGKWVEVDPQRIQEALDHWRMIRREHPDGIDMIEGMRLLAGAPIGGDSDAQEPVADWSAVVAGDWLRSTLERMRTPDQQSDCQPGRDLQATLRPYQADGVRWLWFMTELGLGACLADDMGLGKTIQILDLLLQRKRAAGQRRLPPALLIVPASLVGNWKQEAERFAPSLRICLLHRSEIDAYELARRAQDPASGFSEFDLVVTSYGMVRCQPWLEQLKWSLIILDEAQAIKNSGAAQTRAVKRLCSDRRIIMTGTPIENHVGELWSLLDFSSPGLLGSATEFKRYISRLNRQEGGVAYGGLRRLVQPYILRRQKTDPVIARDLPDKIEMKVECGLTIQQTVLYARVLNDLQQQLRDADGIKRRGLVLAALLQFKQICNHPSQFLREAAYAADHSGKFARLKQLCEPIIARQEKMLVFTQFQSLCEPLAGFLETVFGRSGLVLHGGTPVRRRTELVKEFQTHADKPFFVISIKAGGSGLNLTAASHVVHFDRWWNPAVENQATDRAFRIGQLKNVLVHKFVCRGTIEERIDAMISDKRAVAEQILDADGSPKLTEMSDDDLLKFVALDLNRAASDGEAETP
ncbi:MAG: DEAD/DEAH box helicase, partial [Planctomycetota bacterium]|nr:DEAD/DEAH box helicase [Planctomycetota bacterium]